MIAPESDELLEELQEVLEDYFILSKDTGPIKKENSLSDLKLLEAFYGTLFVAHEKLDDFELPISNYSELGKRLEISEDSIQKAHQRLRDRGIVKKDKDSKIGHRITDGGIKKLLEDLNDE